MRHQMRGRSTFEENKENALLREKSMFSPIQCHRPSNFDTGSLNPNILNSLIPNPTSTNPFPSPYQAFKTHQTIDHLQLRNIQTRNYQDNEIQEVGRDIKQCKENLEKAVANGGVSVEWLLREIKELVDKEPRIQDISAIDNLYDEFLKTKFEPSFKNLGEDKICVPLQQCNNIAENIEKRVTQKLWAMVSAQKKQQADILNGLVTFSNSLVEQLQTEIAELNQDTNDKMAVLEDEVDKLEFEMGQIVDQMREMRVREDRLIEQLIEKVIYKMTYL